MITDGQVADWTIVEHFLAQLGQPEARSTAGDRSLQALAKPQKATLAVEIQKPEFSSKGRSAQAGFSAVQLIAATSPLSALRPDAVPNLDEFTPSPLPAPRSGSQLFVQRLAAIQAGKLYTRLPANSFQTAWNRSTRQPSYEQWKRLLRLEANAVARGQGNNRLSVMVGDSLSLWFPSDRLPAGQLWLNQGISGDTTQGILQRLSAFSQTRPDTIYVMAGINDLRHGATDNEVLWNLRQIMRRLHQAHPQAKIMVQSILPAASVQVSNNQIWRINQKLAAIADQEGVTYLDLSPYFSDQEGRIRSNLTTDGIHLTPQGYATWQWALGQVDTWLTANGRV